MALEILDLGQIEYVEAWRLQEAYAEQIARGERSPTLLLLEHPHVYTFGRMGKPEHLLLDEAGLSRRGVAVHWVDRGGDVTYHGPGQLVGYPLILLHRLAPGPSSSQRSVDQDRSVGSGATRSNTPRADYVGYVRKLEDILVAALSRLGVVSGRRRGFTGVWVQPDVWSRCSRCRPEDRHRPAKLAAIGVKVDARGVTRHGFALNVAPDMSYWDGIVSCGLPGEPVVSLADLISPPPPMSRVKDVVAAEFSAAFATSASGDSPQTARAD